MGCYVTYADEHLIAFGGKRFSGKALAERTVADCGKTLCAPHAKVRNGGEDVLATAS